MEIKNSNYSYDSVSEVTDTDSSRKYLAKVFTWMFIALGVSAATAYAFFTNLGLLNLIVGPTGFTMVGYAVLFAPLAFSLVINFGFNRISYAGMIGLFMGYAVSIGITLSILGLMYTAGSMFTVFLSAAVVFAIMAAAGYYTQQDLTKFGTILYTVFIGVFVVGLINFFMKSAQLDYIISIVFVILMIGLTSYYMQMLKRIGAGLEFGKEESKKLVIIGAFILYTTFINLFMSLLRIFGNRR
jgi:FtsH-binding integral membrane protein